MEHKVPILWETDLFHPHNDPDDHFDLATVFALSGLGRLQLEGILLDYPPKGFGDPAIASAAQLMRLSGIFVPIITGSSKPLAGREDKGDSFGELDTKGADWIGRLLEKASRPVILAVGGSSTDIALAGNRYPELFEEKCAGIYLNAGSAVRRTGEPLEYNVELNPNAFAALFRLPCPVYWFPCFQRITKSGELLPGEYGTYYKARQSALWENISGPLLQYFLYMHTGSEDIYWLKYLEEEPDEQLIKQYGAMERNMWCTPSLLAAAGMGVSACGEPVEWEDSRNILELLPVSVSCGDGGEIEWEIDRAGRHRIFHIREEASYPSAICTALAKLLS